jgi:hypothetical protein
MRYKQIVILLLAAVFWLSAGPAEAQTESSSYAIPAGGTVGGGDKSASANYGVFGAIPLQPAGKIGSANFELIGGFYAGTAFTALYGGSAEATVTAGTNYAVMITITSGSGTDTSGTFYYRQGGKNSFSSAAMTKGDGVLSYTIPGAQLGLRGLEYYFKVKIGSDSLYIGDATDPYAFISNLTNAQAQRPTAVANASYRIISLPVNITGDKTVAAVFLDDLGAVDKKQWRLGSYDGGAVTEYPDAADAQPGRAYWLIARGGKKYGAPGLSMRPNVSIGDDRYYRISLDTGWNQIANPLPFNLAWADILFDTAGVMVSGHPTEILNNLAYSYTGAAYTTVTTIPAWEGVFIHINRADVRIYFPYAEAGGTLYRALADQSPVKESPQSWSVQLAVEANGRTDDGNYAGVAPKATAGVDEYDYFEPPPAPEAPYLAFRLPEGDKGPFRTDFRPVTADGDIWNLDLLPITGRILRVSGLEDIPQNMSAWLKLSSGSIIKLTEGETINLPDNVTSARLLIGTEEFLEGKGAPALPVDYALYQNFPNPFNPATKIKFALPTSGQTKLEIFNVLGQRVTTLIDGEMPAGYQIVTWDGNDGHGHSVASGIYFYRLTCNDFSNIKKMLLLK